MNVSAAITAAAERLEQAGVTEFRSEATSLLKFVLDRPASYLIAHGEYELSKTETAAFAVAVERRSTREPFQYITGIQEFYGLDFFVEPEVLIPRPETELLVEAAIEALAPLENPRFCEIGVGSGCLSISILKNVPHAAAVATDISIGALSVARRNATNHGVAERLVLVEADLIGATHDAFALVVSNPPYIPLADRKDLQIEVRDYEPHSALFAGSDGLDVIRRIVSAAPAELAPGGSLMMEIGFGQADEVRTLFQGSLWSEPDFIQDLQGIDRIVMAKLA